MIFLQDQRNYYKHTESFLFENKKREKVDKISNIIIKKDENQTFHKPR